MPHPFDADLRSALDADEAYQFLPSGTWLEGGCALLAQALQPLIPKSEVMMIGRLAKGIPDHLVLAVEAGGEPFFIDYDGLQTLHELLSKMAGEWNLTDCQLEKVDNQLLADSELLWLSDSVPAFSRYLTRALGSVDTDRLDPAWWEPDESGPAPQ